MPLKTVINGRDARATSNPNGRDARGTLLAQKVLDHHLIQCLVITVGDQAVCR